MFTRVVVTILVFLGFHSAAFGIDEGRCLQGATTIEQRLSCLNGVTFEEVPVAENVPEGMRQFEIKIRQLVDHTNPALGTFDQRLVLLHRNEQEPMVLQTSGYAIFGVAASAATKLFATNQIQVEHRFFASSVPTPLDWSKLDIRQSARDFHNIVAKFSLIYPRRWINTGASKGGMTSIFHRRFYPNDVYGTLADVAPLSFGTADQRYIQFVNEVGGEDMSDCRTQIRQLQIDLLTHREEVTPRIEGTFHQLGGVDVAFEHSVVEFPFIFWQYGHQNDENGGCAHIPSTGTTDEKFDFVDRVNSVEDYSDEGLAYFTPYYFQAATQLGSPANSTAYLEPLRRYDFVIDQYVPEGVSHSYSTLAMHDVKEWMANSGSRFLFIYGEFDPWSAGAYEPRPNSDSYRYVVRHGSHRSRFIDLDEPARTAVIDVLARWLDKQPVQTLPPITRRQLLEEIEYKALQKFRMH